jgi:hypothetical protein
MSRGELRHRVELGFARLTKTVGVDDEAVLSIQAASQRLEKYHFKRVEELTVLSEREMSVFAFQIQYTTFVRPGR